MEGVAKEETVEVVKEEVKHLAERQRRGRENSERMYHSNHQSPPLMQPLSKIPQVMRIIVNLTWSVLFNFQNQRIVRTQTGCSMITLVGIILCVT